MLVKKKQIIKLTYDESTLHVQTYGIAQQDGHIGEMIQVIPTNKDNKDCAQSMPMIMAKVTGLLAASINNE